MAVAVYLYTMLWDTTRIEIYNFHVVQKSNFKIFRYYLSFAELFAQHKEKSMA